MPFHKVTPMRLELAREALLARFRKNLDGSIIQAAAGMSADAEDEPDMVRIGCWWNRQVDAITERLPFPIRAGGVDARSFCLAPWTKEAWSRSVETLIYLSVQQGLKIRAMREDMPGMSVLADTRQAEVFEGMADLLMLWIIPERGIERQSSGRNSRWEVLRNTKRGKEVKWETFQRQANRILAENQEAEKKKVFARHLYQLTAGINLRIQGSDPEYHDTVLPVFIPSDRLPSSAGRMADMGIQNKGDQMTQEVHTDAGRRIKPKG